MNNSSLAVELKKRGLKVHSNGNQEVITYLCGYRTVIYLNKSNCSCLINIPIKKESILSDDGANKLKNELNKTIFVDEIFNEKENVGLYFQTDVTAFLEYKIIKLKKFLKGYKKSSLMTMINENLEPYLIYELHYLKEMIYDQCDINEIVKQIEKIETIYKSND